MLGKYLKKIRKKPNEIQEEICFLTNKFLCPPTLVCEPLKIEILKTHKQ